MARQLKKFNQFRKLPHEVQLMIWDFACYERRIIVVKKGTIVHPTCRLPPALLHVCRMSRYAAIRTYRGKILQSHTPGFVVPFNPYSDALYLSDFDLGSHAARMINSRGQQGLDSVFKFKYFGVTVLALDMSSCLNRTAQLFPQIFDPILTSFPDLNLIMFVISPTKGLASKSIVAFRPLADDAICSWREHVGRLQVIEVVRQKRLLESSNGSGAGNSNGTAPNNANLQVLNRCNKGFPKVGFVTAVQESDWKSRNKHVRAAIKDERGRSLY